MRRRGIGLAGEPGTLCWDELWTTDHKKAADFYTGLFGWEAKDSSADAPARHYTEWVNDAKSIGGMLEITPEMNRIFVRNADIPGTMASIVMDYRVKDAATLTGLKPGDAIQATMVSDDAYWLEDIKITANIDLSDDRARKFALAQAK